MDKDTFLIDLSESKRSDFRKREFSDQSDPQKVFSAIWEFESEVMNGGFLQHFINSWTTPSFSFTLDALEEIGAKHCASLLRRASALVPKDFPEDFDERCDFLNSLSEEATDEFERIDDEFFSRPGEITDQLYRYVEAHPEEFGPVPTS